MNSARNDNPLREIRIFLKTYYWFSPENLAEEKYKFFKHKTYNPQFRYPKLNLVKLAKFKKVLDSMNIPNEKGIKSIIKRKKIEETKQKLQLILARGTPMITKNSTDLYQLKFDKGSIAAAKKDASINVRFKQRERHKAKDTVQEIVKYLKKYKIRNWKVSISKNADFYFQILPRNRLIRVGINPNWDYLNMESALAHEIDGHVIRAQNARAQKDKTFNASLPFYIKTEEGLACFLGDYCTSRGEISRKHHAIKYLAGYFAKSHSFFETYDFLLSYGFTPALAFQRAFRLKRGFTDTSMPGVFAREAMYYEGMIEVKNFIDSGGDIRKLYAGKVGLADLQKIPIPEKQIVPKRIQRYLN